MSVLGIVGGVLVGILLIWGMLVADYWAIEKRDFSLSSLVFVSGLALVTVYWISFILNIPQLRTPCP